MYLICYGTRPEIIKLFPLIRQFKLNNIEFLTLFSSQHIDLFEDFKLLIPEPTYILTDVMKKGQSLNKLSSKILEKIDDILLDQKITDVIIQGDTTTAYSIALASFHHNKRIIHLEAGLRTGNKKSPFPEEMNRKLISQITDIHLAPTELAVNNLKREGITEGVYYVGNTIVDAFKIIDEFEIIKSNDSKSEDNNKIFELKDYILVTLHRRENRGKKMRIMWRQLNKLSEKYKLVYILHPSINDVKRLLSNNITLLEPQSYLSMVKLIKGCIGIITDSGGLQEEAVCANKKVLVCRDTTERPETIESGYGKLVHFNIESNINFLFDKESISLKDNPYGNNVSEKIVNIL